MEVKSTWIPLWHQMDHVSWSPRLFSQKPRLGGRPDTKTGDHGTSNAHNCRFILFYHVWEPAWIEIYWNSIWFKVGHIWLHTTLEDLWPHCVILEVWWDVPLTLSFGPSQCHGHGSWLMCEVAVRVVALGPFHMGFQVPSPTQVNKSQHGGKVLTTQPLEP